MSSGEFMLPRPDYGGRPRLYQQQCANRVECETEGSVGFT